MSRARKRHPVVAVTTAASEKQDRRRASRHRRHRVRGELRQLARSREPDVAPSPEPRRAGSWLFARDGKVWLGARADPRVVRRLRK